VSRSGGLCNFAHKPNPAEFCAYAGNQEQTSNLNKLNRNIMQLNSNITKNSLFGLMSAIVLVSGAAPALASEVTYKQRLEIPMSDGSTQQVYTSGNYLYREWAVVKVKNDRVFSVYHTTQRSRGVFQRWFDHKVIAMKICVTNGFDLTDCQVVNSDTAEIPEGKTIRDLSIEIKYSENGRDNHSKFTIPSSAKPE
jgi:ABC-type bacteriocin/lantibiotic exporter with double-glycine peptidase domain